MNQHIPTLLNDRIEEIAQNLQETNSAYALAMEKSADLYATVDSIIAEERTITIAGCDCTDIKNCFAYKATATAIMQEELYKQGFLDCIQLLKSLGVLV